MQICAHKLWTELEKAQSSYVKTIESLKKSVNALKAENVTLTFPLRDNLKRGLVNSQKQYWHGKKLCLRLISNLSFELVNVQWHNMFTYDNGDNRH